MLLYYKATAADDFVLCDSESFFSKSTGQTASITLGNIPSGSYSVKIKLESMEGTYWATMKNAGSSDVTELSYGSGNEGWVADYDTQLTIKVGEI